MKQAPTAKHSQFGSHSTQRKPHSGHHHDPETFALNLRDLWFTLVLNSKFIGLIVFACMAFTGIYSFFFVQSKYEAKLMFDVSPTAAVSNFSQAIEFLSISDRREHKMESLINFFKSHDFAKEFNKHLSKNPALFKRIFPGETFEGYEQSHRRGLANFRDHEESESSNAYDFILPVEYSKRALSHLNLNYSRHSSFMELKARTANPELSVDLVNTAAKALLEANHSKLLQEIRSGRKFLISQTKSLQAKLDQLEREQVEFKRKHNLISISDAEKLTYTGFQNDRRKIQELKQKMSINHKLQDHVKKELKELQDYATAGSNTQNRLYISQVQHRLNLLQYQAAFLENNSDSQAQSRKHEIELEIDELSEAYKKAMANRTAGTVISMMTPFEYQSELEKTLVGLEKDLEKMKAEYSVHKGEFNTKISELKSLPNKIQTLESIRRNIDITSQLYRDSKRKLQEVEFIEAETPNDLSVLAPASSANVVGMPMSKRYLFAALMGLLFSLTWIFVKDFLIQRVRSKADVEGAGIEVLAEVPTLDARTASTKDFSFGVEQATSQTNKNNTRRRKRGSSSHVVVVENMPDSPEADAFRSMRMRLLTKIHKGKKPTEVENEKQAQVIMITGPHAKSGKSFVSANLAAAVGKANKKTILIDLDLRAPSIYRYYPHLKRPAGMDQLLENGRQATEASIQHITKDLDILFAKRGATHPPEILESKIFLDVIEDLKKKYDYIVIDSPPILATIDPMIIAPIADAIIMVVEYQKTFLEDLQSSLHKIKQASNAPIYCTLNFMNREVYYYYSYHYYAA